jgi:hypothetical protein
MMNIGRALLLVHCFSSAAAFSPNRERPGRRSRQTLHPLSEGTVLDVTYGVDARVLRDALFHNGALSKSFDRCDQPPS